MNNNKKYLLNWLEKLGDFNFQNYENLPDLDLYMDQVVTYLERQFYVFKENIDDKQITSSMINNYVKGKVVNPPISKKYNREHLALLEEVCTLKKVLSIDEIRQILKITYEDKNRLDVFNSFNDLFTKHLDNAVVEAKRAIGNAKSDDSSLTDVALNMSLIAFSYITIAKRILYYIKLSEQTAEDKKKTKEKIEEENEKTKQKEA